jgi:hypothetical protein
MLNRLLDVARGALLVAALGVGGFVWLFVARPATVAAWDAAAAREHLAPAQARLAAARSAGEPARVAAQLERVLASLGHVRKGERLAEIRREAYRLGVAARLDAGAPAAALAHAEAWFAFDPLDLDARAAQAETLTALGRPDALAVWRELFARAPDRERFAAPVIRVALQRGDAEAAAAACLALLQAGGMPRSAVAGQLTDDFGLEADVGQGFDPVQRRRLRALRAGERLQVEFTPPSGARGLRVHLPALAALELRDVALRIKSATHDVTLPLVQLAAATGAPVSCVGCRPEGNVLHLEGHEAPSLAWSLGGSMALDTQWALLATPAATVSDWLAPALRLRAMGELGNALVASARVEDADGRRRYLAVRARALQASELRLGCDAETPTPMSGVPVAEGAMFQRSVRRTAQLTLVFPDVAGARLTLRLPWAVRLASGSTVRVDGDGFVGDEPGALLRLDLSGSTPEFGTVEAILR